MLTIKIELIANRYHANPWNRAHVEGAIEWPPSPWRLLRAILAGGFAAGLSQADVVAVVEPLSVELPQFYLPPGSYLQTRSPRKDRNDTTDLFSMGKDIYDAYLNFDSGDRTIWVQWPVELSLINQPVLMRCLAYCRYLGRREADAVWCIAENEAMPTANALPDETGTVQLAACDGDIEAMLKSPYQSQVKEKRAVFAGLRWVNYRVQEVPAERVSSSLTYYRAEIAISTKGKPQSTSMLYWIEKLHRKLAKIGTPNFTGCDEQRNPLTSHKHVFVQPKIEGTELVGFGLYCDDGFTETEVNHLYSVRKLYGKGSEMLIRVVNLASDQGSAAQVWESETPFFLSRWPLTRHGKPRLIKGSNYQKDGPEHQALKGLCYLPQFNLDPKLCSFEENSQGLSLIHEGLTVAIAVTEKWVGAERWKRDRVHGKIAKPTGYKVKLLFSKPVEGPIAIGYSAHFGFGMLRGQVDVESDSSQLAAEIAAV